MKLIAELLLRWASPALVWGIASLHAAIPAISADVTVDEQIRVSYPPDIASNLAQQFGEVLARERRLVRGWWGATFEGPILAEIVEDRGTSMALVPGWRGDLGTMLVPAPRVRDRDAASLHELVHIYAPNGNRFLAEGLAVYAQEALQGQRAYPNFGRDLHEMARDRAGKISLTALDKIATPRSLGRQGKSAEAYLASGSFVRFLIEHYGMATFRAIYDLTPMVPGRRVAGSPDRWREIYGPSLTELEGDWRQFLSGNNPVRSAPAD